MHFQNKRSIFTKVKADGLDVGVYFFAQAISEEEAIEEANFVLKQLNGYELQIPVVYDPESILHSDARTDQFAIWQYTQSGQVDGIDGNVDINIQMIKNFITILPTER